VAATCRQANTSTISACTAARSVFRCLPPSESCASTHSRSPRRPRRRAPADPQGPFPSASFVWTAACPAGRRCRSRQVRSKARIPWHVPDALAHELRADRRGRWLSRTDGGVAAKDDGDRGQVGRCESDRRPEARASEAADGRTDDAIASRITRRRAAHSGRRRPRRAEARTSEKTDGRTDDAVANSTASGAFWMAPAFSPGESSAGRTTYSTKASVRSCGGGAVVVDRGL
jgi:hypothetical protein